MARRSECRPVHRYDCPIDESHRCCGVVYFGGDPLCGRADFRAEPCFERFGKQSVWQPPYAPSALSSPSSHNSTSSGLLGALRTKPSPHIACAQATDSRVSTLLRRASYLRFQLLLFGQAKVFGLRECYEHGGFARVIHSARPHQQSAPPTAAAVFVQIPGLAKAPPSRYCGWCLGL